MRDLPAFRPQAAAAVSAHTALRPRTSTYTLGHRALALSNSDFTRETCAAALHRAAAGSRQARSRPAAQRKHWRKRDAGLTAGGHHLLRRALGDDAPAAGATFGAEVDHPVGLGDHVQVVLDDDDAVAGVDQAVQHANKLLDVGHVQPHGRLFEDVERVRRTPAPGRPKRATPLGGGAAGAWGSPSQPLRVTSSRTLTSSVTSLMRCASPPESVGDGWPSVR